jgi:hypothetical protein
MFPEEFDNYRYSGSSNEFQFVVIFYPIGNFSFCNTGTESTLHWKFKYPTVDFSAKNKTRIVLLLFFAFN